MARISLLISALVLSVVLFQSCDKNKPDCAFIAPKMVYVGFNEAETDTMVVRRYAKGTNFTSLLDTFRATKAMIKRTVIGADSVVLYPGDYTRLNGEFFANDWEIALPGANHTDRFTDVAPRFAKETEASGHCQSFVKSMNANGLIFQYENWYGDTYKYFISK